MRIKTIIAGAAVSLAALLAAVACSSTPDSTTYNLSKPPSPNGLSTIGGPSPATTQGFVPRTYAVFSGHGNSGPLSYVIPSGSGDYAIRYSFHGNGVNNNPQSFGYGSADTFALTEMNINPDSSAPGFPDMQAQSGSGEIPVSDDSGVHQLQVGCDESCRWTLKVIAEP